MASFDYSHRRTGGCMTEHDFGETYTYLELFFRTYVTHENEVEVVLQAILDTYVKEYNHSEPQKALHSLRNPRHAGRKKKDIPDMIQQKIIELHREGYSIRDIAEEIRIPKSSIERLLKIETSQN